MMRFRAPGDRTVRLSLSRAVASYGEPRTEPPSDEVPRSSGIPLRMGEAAKPVTKDPVRSGGCAGTLLGGTFLSSQQGDIIMEL